MKRKNRLIKQRLIGALTILIGVAGLWLCSAGTTLQDKDGTALLLVIPFGIYLLLTKRRVIL